MRSTSDEQSMGRWTIGLDSIHLPIAKLRALRWFALLPLFALAQGCVKGGSAAHPLANSVSIQELMDSIVDPSADVVWDSVGVVADRKGRHELAPKTDDEWSEIRR